MTPELQQHILDTFNALPLAEQKKVLDEQAKSYARHCVTVGRPERMRVKDNPTLVGPVVERGRDYITIQVPKIDDITRSTEAFEPAPSGPPLTEDDQFILEAAEQHGFEHLDDEATIYTATDHQIVALVKAARKQGQEDAGRGLHEAYLRLRGIIPGAFKTPFAPSAEQVWKITEDAAKALVKATQFQARCQGWLDVVTHDDPTDLDERIARFLEEALELVQALGMTRDAALQLVYYTFSRPAGEPAQEFGGMLTTAAVLADFTGRDLMACGEAELARVWAPEVIEKIRGKRSRRHGRGPLPGTVEG